MLRIDAVSIKITKINVLYYTNRVGAVSLWLVCSTPDRAFRVQALAGDIVLCSLARHFTLIVPLSSIQVYKRIMANKMLGLAL